MAGIAFLDVLASLDFKLSVSESFTFFTASASTGLSELFLLKILVNNRRNCGWLPHIQWWVAIVCRLSRQSLATLRSLWASIQRQCYRYKIVFSSNSVLNCTAAITNTLQLSSSVATSGQQNLATAIMVISAGDRQTKRWSRFFQKKSYVHFIFYSLFRKLGCVKWFQLL